MPEFQFPESSISSGGWVSKLSVHRLLGVLKFSFQGLDFSSQGLDLSFQGLDLGSFSNSKARS